MIPQVEKVAKRKHESFVVGEYSNKYFERAWHYHPEYELLLITNGHGVRVVGDTRNPFSEYDLVLVSGDVPHAWISDASFFEPDSSALCESIYVQFDRAILGNRFINLPEMQSILRLLDRAKYGLSITGECKSGIIQEIEGLPRRSGLDRLLGLIKILDLFQDEDYSTILNDDYFQNSFIANSNRVRKVHEYVMNNYMHDVKVQDVAELVEMNVSSFCRFFKKRTSRTFSQYVKETRIDFAQQLLILTDLPSNQIGFECGFSSVAYFNQCFKEISKISPLEYRAKMQGSLDLGNKGA